VFSIIAGNPNVGKSTLLNRLVGSRIAITSHKPQTTRTRITGILTEFETQYVFIDTPGFHAPRNKLDERMQRTISEAIADVDAALLLVPPKESLNETELELMREINGAKIPLILVMNKADTVSSANQRDFYLESLARQGSFSAVLAVSALKGEGIEELKTLLAGYAVEGPFLFDEDALTDVPEKTIAAEIIRENLLKFLSDELPHGTAVVIERFSERAKKEIVDIEATIFCEKQSHKGMIIGKDGAMLKRIATGARIGIERFSGCRVNLKCWVKVRENWRNDERHIREIGNA